MAGNKTKPTQQSVEAFLDAVTPDARREDAKALCAMMQRLSGEPPRMWGPTIVGFGQYHYRYESGREGDLCRVGFSPRKPAHVLYVAGGSPRHAELKARLGKVSSGAACLYLKRLADVDTAVLEEMIAESLAYMREAYPETG